MVLKGSVVSPLTKGPYLIIKIHPSVFMGFSGHVNNWTNIDPHSDPENPEKNPEEHDVWLRKVIAHLPET